MSRTLKLVLYGLLYLGILALVALPFVYPLIFPVPTCTDGIQNQSEAGIDCGGSCEDCELKTLSLEIGEEYVLEVGERSSVLVRVKNPSKNFGALKAPYKLQVIGLLGELIKVVEGELNILPGEEKYIAEVGLDVKASDINEVTFELDDFEFVSKKDLLDYKIKIEDVETSFPEQLVQTKGLLVNDSGITFSRVVLTALFYTEEGKPVNVGTMILRNLEAFGERDFVISAPRNSLSIDVEQTEISWRVIW